MQKANYRLNTQNQNLNYKQTVYNCLQQSKTNTNLAHLLSMISTSYIHKKISYFFSRSEIIDWQIGSNLTHSINYCLDCLEQVSNVSMMSISAKLRILQSALCLFSQMVTIVDVGQEMEKNQIAVEEQADSGFKNIEYLIDPQNYVKIYENDGLKCCVFALKNYMESINSSSVKITIVDEMIIKSLTNLLYTLLYGHQFVVEYYKTKGNQMIESSTKELKKVLQQLQLDDLMIKMVTLTLQTYYLPIKKLVMLYTKFLSINFTSDKSQQLYTDIEVLDLSANNLLTQNYLQSFKEKNKPGDIKMKSVNNPIEAFYSKHNIGDCPLAQSIVVGLLRSLLTICNSQSHKKFIANLPKGSGADSYRQWQISYQFLLQPTKQCQDYKKYLTPQGIKLLKDYQSYNQISESSSNEKILNSSLLSIETHYQFYRHKIYTTSAIATFFTFLLVSFKKNTMIQFTYLYQLISDANGILVFLKFLTDKFEAIQVKDEEEPVILDKKWGQQGLSNRNEQLKINPTKLAFNLKFKDQVMLTVYSVLLVLYGACNNYAEKTRSYLFEYNSYLIIKKIPHIFMKVHKNDDQLPSEQQIQAQFGQLGQRKNSSSEYSNYQAAITNKVKELTQLCYSLLKIQIPFFSKKMKQNSNNMKMIVQIYCQMPKKTNPIRRSELDKLLLKNQMRKIQHEKYILSVEELKTIHNEYNNLYYWSNEQAKINEENDKNKANEVQNNGTEIRMSREEMQKWLQENVWKFYD